MRVTGLDGVEYNWRLAGHAPPGDDDRPRSSYHLAARGLLRRLYPSDRLLEEVPLPGCGSDLRADFYLALRRLMVEVQGEQHYRLVGRFHGDTLGYLASRRRDLDKKRWCVINGIVLAEFPYHEDENGWRRRIRDAYAQEDGR